MHIYMQHLFLSAIYMIDKVWDTLLFILFFLIQHMITSYLIV